MKVVILAGGYGTRLSEVTNHQPKPMVTIGGRPIIWHIMKHFDYYGFNDFIVCCGYKGYALKEYFANYYLHNSDFSINLESNETAVISKKSENWKVTLVDTGEGTQTGGRLKRVQNLINSTFMMTYGDGVSDVDIKLLVQKHISSGKAATVTAVQPPGRFGALKLNGDLVSEFAEKIPKNEGWINGGYFVLEPKIFDLIDNDMVPWEADPISNLVSSGDLIAYKHEGFWRPMDTLRDKRSLDEAWASGEAPWKIWQ